jgi:hypothetical protein
MSNRRNNLRPNQGKKGKLQYVSSNGDPYDFDKILEYIINFDKFKEEVKTELKKIRTCIKNLAKVLDPEYDT